MNKVNKMDTCLQDPIRQSCGGSLTASLADQSEARSSQLMAVEGLPARLVELVTGGDRALQTGTSDAIARLVMAVPNQVSTGGKISGPMARGVGLGE